MITSLFKGLLLAGICLCASHALPVLAQDLFEPDNTAASARLITNEVPQFRSIHAAGNVDWAEFTLDQYASNVVLSVIGGTDQLLWLEVFGPSSSTVEVDYDFEAYEASGYQKVELDSLAPGTYYLKVYEAIEDVVGSYTLEASWQEIGGGPDKYESDNTAATAKVIDNGTLQSRTIHAEGNVDWSKFTLNEAALNVVVEISGHNDPFLSIEMFGPNSATDYLESDSSRITLASLEPGTYYLKVAQGLDEIVLSYSLNASWSAGATSDVYEPDDDGSSAGTLVNGAAQTRNIHIAGNFDWASFTLSEFATNILVELAGTSDTNLWIDVYGPDNPTNEVDYDFEDYIESNFSRVALNHLGPGRYFVKVYQIGDEPVSFYTLTAGWSNAGSGTDPFEPDDVAEAAKTLTNGTPQLRSIDLGGNVDWARFTLDEIGTNILIQLFDSDFDIALEVYGPDNSTNEIIYDFEDYLASDFTRVALEELLPGTYYTKVYSLTDEIVPSYLLSASWKNAGGGPDAYEPDDLPALGSLVASGISQTRSIHASANPDWAKIVLTEFATNVLIEVLGGNTNLWLEVYGPDDSATEVEYDSASYLASHFSRVSLDQLAPGTYYLKIIEAADESVLFYSLTANWSSAGGGPDPFEPDNTAASAQSITNGSVQVRSIHTAGDADWAVFTITGHTRDLVIETIGHTGDTEVSLYEGSGEGTVLGYNDDKSDTNTFSRLAFPELGPGTYLIKVGTFDSNAAVLSYTLAVKWRNPADLLDTFEPDDLPVSATDIENGVIQNRSIHAPGNVDWVKLNLPQGAVNLLLETSGASGDTLLSIFASNDSDIALQQNDDASATNRFSSIAIPALPPGTYYIRIAEFDTNVTMAAYTLHAQWELFIPDPFEFDDLSASAADILSGVPQNRSIHLAGNTDWAKFFVSRADTRVAVETSGNFGDTELWVYGPDSLTTLVGHNDDQHETNRFSKLVLDRLPIGTYWIKVEPFDKGGMIESYQLQFSSEIVVFPAGTNDVTGQWDFSNGDLAATIGQPLAYFDSNVQDNTTFGSTDAFGIPPISGAVANVMRFNPASVGAWGGYRMPHGAKPNGGGAYVNRYTVILDVLYPSASNSRWRSLFQTNPGNENDADLFFNPENAMGIVSQYHGHILPNIWYRVAFSVDLQGSTLRKYIDGRKVGEQTLPEGLDARWSLDPTALLFADENAEAAPGYVNSIQFRESPMSDTEISELGGAAAEGIPYIRASPHSKLSITLTGTLLNVTWSGSPRTKLQKAFSLMNTQWQDVQGSLGASSTALRSESRAEFYRLVTE